MGRPWCPQPKGLDHTYPPSPITLPPPMKPWALRSQLQPEGCQTSHLLQASVPPGKLGTTPAHFLACGVGLAQRGARLLPPGCPQSEKPVCLSLGPRCVCLLPPPPPPWRVALLAAHPPCPLPVLPPLSAVKMIKTPAARQGGRKRGGEQPSWHLGSRLRNLCGPHPLSLPSPAFCSHHPPYKSPDPSRPLTLSVPSLLQPAPSPFPNSKTPPALQPPTLSRSPSSDPSSPSALSRPFQMSPTLCPLAIPFSSSPPASGL